MDGRVTKVDKPVFKIEDRDYTIFGWYLEDTPQSKGDALITVYHRDKMVREFLFPAYKIWNIAAHASDIIDSEIASDDHGYRLAAWTGI